MVSKKILKYVDAVMCEIDADDAHKVKMENDLIRCILQSDKCNDLKTIVEKFGTPRELAIKMMKHDDEHYRLSDRQKRKCESRSLPAREYERHMPQRPYGDYMREESNTNIKLLYIPLIQISSETERIRLPIVDYDDYNCYY
jgi:hypothetical protein